MKKPVLESSFNKVAGLMPQGLQLEITEAR